MILMAKDVLDAVERWAVGYLMIRETGAVMSDGRRADAILIPLSWETESYKHIRFRQGVVGVEVKCSIYDFRNGIKNGQFEAYQQATCGVYVATPPQMQVKRADIPKGVGWLSVGELGDVRCVRHPSWTGVELTQADMWRILWCVTRWFNERKETLRREDSRVEDRISRAMGMAARQAIARLRNAEDGQ